MLQYLAVAFLTDASHPRRAQILSGAICLKPWAINLSSKSFAVPAETVHPLPWRVTDYARPLLRVKYRLRLSTLFGRREDNWGKIIAAINARW